MYLKDTQGRYVMVNDAWLKMVGLAASARSGAPRTSFPEGRPALPTPRTCGCSPPARARAEIESQRTAPTACPQWLIVRKAVLRRADAAWASSAAIPT